MTKKLFNGKLFCWIITLVLIVGIIPMQVFAAETVRIDPPESAAANAKNNAEDEQAEDAGAEIPGTAIIEEKFNFTPKYLVVYNPLDGSTFNTWFKVWVKSGDLITEKPNLSREGYTLAWAKGYDKDGKPILWDFDKDRVTCGLTLCAVWIKDTDPSGGGEEGNGGENGGGNGGSFIPDGGSGGGSGGKGGTQTPDTDPAPKKAIKDKKPPLTEKPEEENKLPSENYDQVPNTGKGKAITATTLTMLMLSSLGMFLNRKKRKI